MKKFTKKAVSLFLCAVMILTALPLAGVTAFAEAMPEYLAASGYFEYKILEDGTAEIANYMGNATTLNIPSTLDEYKVTRIRGYAFENCESLTSVTIPDSVTSISSSAFCNTKYYNNASNWENGVLYIGKFLIEAKADKIPANYTIKAGTKVVADYAFDDCINLKSVTIPDSVTNIGDGAFQCCESLTSITIPDSVTSIGGDTFWNCIALTSITLPNSITSIGSSAFFYTGYYNNVSNWENGVLYIGKFLIKAKSDEIPANYTIKAETKVIADYALRNCENLTSLTIPNSVTSIGNRAFEDCTSLTSVKIPNSVTSVGDYAFYYCDSLTSIIIPDSVTSIGNGAFSNCTSLTSIVIPNGVTSIGNGAFWCCTSLKSITLPNSVTSIGYNAFYECTSLTNITIPASVDSIGWGTFENCTCLTSITVDANNKNYSSQDGVLFNKDKTVLIQYPAGNARISYTIPSSVTNIDHGAFSGSKNLTGITVPNSVISIGGEAFENCTGLISVVIPDSVINLDYGVFSGCKNLKSVTFSNSVTSIGGRAFENCTNLTNITIPDSVTSIDYCAFENCTSLTKITIPDSVTSIDGDAFYNTGYYNNVSNWENGVLYIGKFLIKAKANEIPANYTIKAGTKVIADDAFEYCEDLTSVTIPNSVVSIGSSAFYYCTNLTSIKIPDSVTSIDYRAFENCTSLTSITIPDSVTSIGYETFYNTGYYNDASNWTDGVLYVGNYLINTDYETVPENYTVKAGTKVIADWAFSYRKNLTNITIPNSVVNIGYGAFENCTSLTSITIPDSVTSIGGSAFYYCFRLTSITIPDSVTSIGYEAFNRTGYYNNTSNWENGVLYIGEFLIDTKNSEIPENYTVKAGTKLISDRAFYWCNNLKSITIPESVTNIGQYIVNYNVTIRGYAGSAAEEYAKEYGNKFVAINEAIGDINGDGKITTVDAKWILKNIAGSKEFSDEQIKAADLNGDGKLSVVDVKWVLQIIAGTRDAETLEIIKK